MIRFVLYVLFFFILGSLNSYGQTNCSSFSTYFGGTQFDEARGVCIDAFKNTYIIGNTYSTDLPITNGLINNSHSGNYDVFISKFDSCGALIWCTYFGSTGFDSGEKIAVSNDGTIVFCGYTNGVDLPVTSGCFQAINNGGYDCFITKITPNGTIIWSTYFGKTNGDFAYDIKTDEYNNVIIGGTTTSPNLYTTAASFQPNIKANTDAFIARFSKNGMLKWNTYYGGNGNEDIHALAIDKNFNIIGVGGTFSTNLSTSINAYQSTNNGVPDSYIIKLDSNCIRVFSTYFGGMNVEDSWGVVTDTLNNIYVAGNTNSNDFYTTTSAYQTTLNGTLDDWSLSKWDENGTLLSSTLFGGSAKDLSCRLTFIAPDILCFLGKTESTNMPVIGNNYLQTNSGNYDAFLASFNTINLQPILSGYYGGSTDEEPVDVFSSSNNSIVFVGSTNSVNYPLSSSPYQNSLNNSNDATITRLHVQHLTSTSETENKLISPPFPNPFQNYISINYPTEFTLEIKNILGELVFKTNKQQTINTQHFELGLYLVTVHTKHSTSTYKMIKN